MTTRLHPTPTQPLATAMAMGPPHMDWCLFEDERCANAHEHRQLRRLSMHLLECHLRALPFASRQAGELPVKSQD